MIQTKTFGGVVWAAIARRGTADMETILGACSKEWPESTETQLRGLIGYHTRKMIADKVIRRTDRGEYAVVGK